MPIGMTLTKFLLQEQRKIPGSKGRFTSLFADLAVAAKLISREVNKAGILDILGAAGFENIQGEEVQKLDVFANEAITQTMQYGGHLAAMASEETEEIIKIDPKKYPRGKYLLLFDPLDGSSNIDVNISVGTIFSVLRCEDEDNVTTADFLKPGIKQVAAGYTLYGSSTMFVYSTGHGVHGFTLDPSVGEFLLSYEDIRIPERGNIYSVNEANSALWYEGTSRYIQKLKEKDGQNYKARYVGSLVSDFHRNLLKGGVFLYPGDKKAKEGKLRLLYEANPLAFLAEQAGGAASTGDTRILDVVPTAIHQRIPLIIGSKADVEEAEEFWKAQKIEA
jgi:fructose-1,6-bisphosphatase I